VQRALDEKREISNIDNILVNGIVAFIIKDSNGKYVDVDGNPIIGGYTHFLGYTLRTTTFYWIVGGVGGFILLIIIVRMMRRSNNQVRYNNGY